LKVKDYLPINLIAFIAFGFVMINSAFSQNLNSLYLETSEKIVRRALVDQIGYQMLGELCEIGPRLSGSDQSIKAIHWAKKKMEYLGFDKVWLQPAMVPKWIRGDFESARIVNSKTLNGRALEIAAFGGSVGTDRDGITAEVVSVNNFNELNSISNSIKGKIVFFNRALDLGETNTFSGYGNAVNQRTQGAIEAAKYGAAAVLVRSVTTKHDKVPHVGVMYYVDSLPKIPSAAIGYQDADFLYEAIRKEPSLKINVRLSCKTFPDVQSYNVIGELIGTEKPNEVIVVGGHFDSWDKGCGAHDDGAGCIQSMEVLDLFNRLNIKPKRTVRCVFFINEENGVRGAIGYANYADTSKEIHYAAIESDRGAFTPRGFYVDADSAVIQKIESWLPYLQKARIEWVRKGGSGVDISFIKNIKAKIGYVPDDQRYMDVHHSANDTFDTVHPRELELGSAAMAILTFLLSEEGIE